MTKISAEEAIGKSIYDLFADTPQTRIAEKKYREVLKTGLSQTFVNEYKIGGKDYNFEISAYPSRDGISVFIKDITERKHAEEALKNFSRRILSIREEEKRKISVTVNREIGHITGALNLLADSVEKKIRSSDLEAALEACRKFKPIFHDFISNLRKLMHDLLPPELDIIGLAGTLNNYFSNIEKETSLKIKFQSNVNEKKIRDDKRIVLFRIVQEAVNNILKHSHADRVRVDLQSHGRTISLAIKDNGQGFVPMKEKKEAESGIGLRLIREMVESLDGSSEIHSSPGKGTKLLVSLPATKPPNPKPSSAKRKSKRNCKRKRRR